MTRFEARNVSEAHVPVDRETVFEVLRDPDQLADLTPLIRAIATDGDLWCWQLRSISALGASIEPAFTERMRFTPGERIDFTHEPPAGADERAGADGRYELSDLPDGYTRLFIDITIHAELPLPRISRRAVEAVMRSSMEATGNRFADNLYGKLDIDPARVRILDPA